MRVKMKEPGDYLDNTLSGLGLLIRGIGERIEKMIDSTYKVLSQRGKNASAQGAA
jgi:hypothetical protein